MLRIDQTYFINASPERVWEALTDEAVMAKWSGTSAHYEPRAGGEYVLWDDYVRGTVLVFDPPIKLAQTWQPDNWAIHDSVVTFALTKKGSGTQLDLTHEKVQPEDYDGTANGWDEFYIGAIKALLEAENVKPGRKAGKKSSRVKKPAAKAKHAPVKKRTVRTASKRKAPLKKKSSAAQTSKSRKKIR